MRLVPVVVAAILTATPAFAQTGQPPAKDDTASAGQPQATDLPVSVEKIRERLENRPAQPLRGLSETPVFRVQVNEKQRFEDLVAKIKFDKVTPLPGGGTYAYEQQQSVWSKQQHPEMQPYGAFNQGQLATILIENFLEKYLGGRALSAIGDFQHREAEEAAREEVQQALADFWSYQARQPRQPSSPDADKP